MRFSRCIRVLAYGWGALLVSGLPSQVNATAFESAPPATAAGEPPALSVTAPHAPGVVLVKYRAGATASQREHARSSSGGGTARPLSPQALRTERLELAPGVSVPQALQALAADPNVELAEPDYLLRLADTPDDPRYVNGSLWGMYGDTTTPSNLYGSQAAEAWAEGYTGSRSIYIGMLDEGVQLGHPELIGNIWTNPYDPQDGIDNDGNGYIDDLHGWDFFNNDNTVFDGSIDDHGTHVAGTLAAQGDNGIGVVGVNWRATLVPAKFVGPSFGYTSGAIAALDYLTDLKLRHGINVVVSNNSWAGDIFSQLLLDAINRGGDADMLFVAAAGNGDGAGVGLNNDVIPNYPANYQCTTRFDTGLPRGYDCVIAVASITSTGARSAFSNYGAVSVDLGAPGSEIWSTWPTNGYMLLSGTSMATPHVSGAIALCASMNPALTAQQLRDVTLGTVRATASLQGVTQTGGRLDMGAMAPFCKPAIGGKHLTIDADRGGLSWIDGTIETGYTLFRYKNGVQTSSIGLGASASSYTPGSLSSLDIWCYLLGAQSATGLIGLSDLECVMRGLKAGSIVPKGFRLSLHQSDNAYLTWGAPEGGAHSYTLLQFPLDGGSAFTTTLSGGYTAAVQPVPDSGACFQLTAHRFGLSGSTDVVCGIPGVTTLSGAATGEWLVTSLAGVTERLRELIPE